MYIMYISLYTFISFPKFGRFWLLHFNFFLFHPLCRFINLFFSLFFKVLKKTFFPSRLDGMMSIDVSLSSVLSPSNNFLKLSFLEFF